MPAVAIPALHGLPLECSPGDLASVCTIQGPELALVKRGVTWPWSVYLAGALPRQGVLAAVFAGVVQSRFTHGAQFTVM